MPNYRQTLIQIHCCNSSRLTDRTGNVLSRDKLIFTGPFFRFILQAYKGQRNSNDERHGFGKAILPNGDAYVGTYKNGHRHGRGQYRFKNGAIYQGCYREGLRHGKGVMRYPDKSKYEGDP